MTNRELNLSDEELAKRIYECTLEWLKQEHEETQYNNWDADLSSEYESLTLFNHLFKFIKWEDKEAYNIEKLLEIKGE